MKKFYTEAFEKPGYGSIRLLFDTENCEVLFCGIDIARLFGYEYPQTYVRNFCKEIHKYRIKTDGGLQNINFIGKDDVLRLFKHSKAADASERYLYAESCAYKLIEKVSECRTKELQEQIEESIEAPAAENEQPDGETETEESVPQEVALASFGMIMFNALLENIGCEAKEMILYKDGQPAYIVDDNCGYAEIQPDI